MKKSKRKNLFEITVVISYPIHRECRLRVFTICAEGMRDAKCLSEMVADRLDAEQIDAISDDALDDDYIDPVQVVSVRALPWDSRAPALTREQVESENYSALVDGMRSCSRAELAFHEAGHALMAFQKGITLDKVEVYDEPTQNGELGQCLTSGHKNADDDLMFILAGPVSQAMFANVKFSVPGMVFGRRSLAGGADFRDAYELSRQMHRVNGKHTDQVIEAHLLYVATQVRVHYLEDNWHIVERIAAALLQKKVLSGDEVVALCGDVRKL